MPQPTKQQPHPLAVRLRPQDVDWLRRERENTGTPVNAMVSKAVQQYITRMSAARKAKESRGTHS